MLVTIIAHHLCTVNKKNAIVLLTLHQKYHGLKLLYQRRPYARGALFLCVVLVVYHHKPLEQQILIKDYIPLAQRNDKRCKAACGDDRAALAELLLHSLDKPVDRAGGRVHNAALHTVNGVCADDPFWGLKGYLWKLRGALCQGV